MTSSAASETERARNRASESFAYSCDDGEAAALGHVDVEQSDVRFLLEDAGDGCFDITGGPDDLEGVPELGLDAG